MSLSADGGTAITQTVNFQILQVNDAPTLNPNSDKPLEVKEGANNVVFSDDQFGLKDPDIDSGQQAKNQIIVQINSLPEHGTLYFNGSPVVKGSSFSYDQLSGLTYTHNGPDVARGASDFFTVKVFDGADTLTAVYHDNGNSDIFVSQKSIRF